MDETKVLADYKAEIQRLQKIVDLMEESTPTKGSKGKGKRKKRGPMSKATKKKIALGRKAAWAKKKAEQKKSD